MLFDGTTIASVEDADAEAGLVELAARLPIGATPRVAIVSNSGDAE